MSPRLHRLLPLGQLAGPAGGTAADLTAASTAAAGTAGAKAARLAVARAAGFPVLPGWVLPVAESRPAIRAAAAAVRGGRPAAARRAALGCPPDPELARELRAAVCSLGGRVIVRSSSPLERDPRWAGAFTSVAEVGPADAVTAVRSCWAAAFAVDPLARLASCGLPLDALELGILIQPELRPAAGGTARVTPAAGATGPGPVDVVVEGVRGHPGALLAGWAEGASGFVRLTDPGAPDWPEPASAGPLTELLGADLVASVARLAAGVYWALGDASIEWAADNGTVWLLQAMAAGPAPAPPPEPAPPRVLAVAAGAGAGCQPGLAYPTRELMPLLAAAVQAGGSRLAARPAAAGQAAGRLVACRPHERPAAGCRDAILLVDRPVPALAPLLFAARGVIARSGAAGAHLAEVARSLAVPMVTGCRPELITGPVPARDGWLAAIDGSTGEVALLPA